MRSVITDRDITLHQIRPTISLWQFMKNFFNERTIGTVVSRQELIFFTQLRGYGLRINSYTTIDTYRNYLTKAGYLSIQGRGKYKIERGIETDLSLADVKTMAYRHTFTAIENRLEKNEFFKEEDFEI